MKFKIDYEYIRNSILLLIGGTIVLLTIFTWNTKNQAYREYKYRKITYGQYTERVAKGRGATVYRYEFRVKRRKYTGSMTTATFPNESPLSTQEFIVLYNELDPSESSMFFNLRATDSIKELFKDGHLRNIPVEAYQHFIDSFYFDTFFKGVAQYFPPYYKKEDFPELEYLWGEEE